MPDSSIYGFGALPSPADARDFPLTDALAAIAVATGDVDLPPSYLLSNLPPVRNQGDTPQCVAYSTGYEKARQDFLDMGRWFDFDESRFFAQIGGSAAGAVMRIALDQLLHEGYPTIAGGDRNQHRIAAYYRVPLTERDVKTAIAAFGGVLVIGDWSRSWCPWLGGGPNANGILPSFSSSVGGHAWYAIGWNDSRGTVIGEQSWGASFGLGGRFEMKWSDFVSRMWEAWKATDVRTYATKELACRAPIRSGPRPGSTALGTIAKGASVRTKAKIAGSAWSFTCGTKKTGSKWYPVVAINGKPVSNRFPGRSVVYVAAGRMVGG